MLNALRGPFSGKGLTRVTGIDCSKLGIPSLQRSIGTEKCCVRGDGGTGVPQTEVINESCGCY